MKICINFVLPEILFSSCRILVLHEVDQKYFPHFLLLSRIFMHEVICFDSFSIITHLPSFLMLMFLPLASLYLCIRSLKYFLIWNTKNGTVFFISSLIKRKACYFFLVSCIVFCNIHSYTSHLIFRVDSKYFTPIRV